MGRKAAERIKPLGGFVGRQKPSEVGSALILAVVEEAFDRRILDSAVHAHDLTVGPWMVGLRQPVLDTVDYDRKQFADILVNVWSTRE